MIPELEAKIDDILKAGGDKREAYRKTTRCLISYEKKEKRYFTGAEWDKYIRYITHCLKI